MKAIKVACASNYVAGNYGYRVVGVFEYQSRVGVSGAVRYGAGTLLAGPFSSLAKAERIARQIAEERGVQFVSGYGSLYNRAVPVSAVAVSK